MDLELTDDQELFRETTAKFLEATGPLSTVREWADGEPEGYPADWWRQGAELGWTSLLVGEEDGGGSVSGHGLLDLVIVAEEMGRMVAPGPLIPTNVVAAALSAAGTADQRAQFLPDLLSGESVASWLLAEPGGAGLPTEVALAAERRGDDLVLSGAKGPAEAAATAGLFLVVALVDGRATQLLVPADSSGVTVTRAGSVDLVRRFASVEFDEVVVGPGAVLGAVGEAADDVERGFQVAVALQCASIAGVLDKVLGITVEYAFDRYSFGRQLASYQALKHRFADMKLWTEASLATALAAARAVDGASPKAAELVSAAKSYIGDRAPVILQDCVQLHGGIGVTWDHDLHLYLRRALLDRATFGTPADHRERIAAGLHIEEHHDH